MPKEPNKPKDDPAEGSRETIEHELKRGAPAPKPDRDGKRPGRRGAARR